ncbi:MAG: hypothetical protein LBD59_12375 [Prevotellaceae bacterium]|nr:hypothetical protein [Prevotellaceae bacterium]
MFYSFISVADFDFPFFDDNIAVFYRNIPFVDSNYTRFAARNSVCRPENFFFQSKRFCRRPEDSVFERQYPRSCNARSRLRIAILRLHTAILLSATGKSCLPTSIQVFTKRNVGIVHGNIPISDQ